jgi:hypothetical protein
MLNHPLSQRWHSCSAFRGGVAALPGGDFEADNGGKQIGHGPDTAGGSYLSAAGGFSSTRRLQRTGKQRPPLNASR